MMLHICTTDSLAAGLEDIPPSECLLCGRVTMIATWCGPICKTCGAEPEAGASRSIARARRKTHLTRKEWAQVMGVKPKTVSVYDHDRPSKAYIERATQVIKQFFDS